MGIPFLMILGVLSDSHGLLRPELWPALEGVEHILHAGDVGPAGLLTELEAVAPVTAVWGNTDGWVLRERLPEVAEVELGGRRIVVLHGHQFGRSPTPTLLAERFPEADLVIYGHTHLPREERVGSVLTLNPGACGHRRFSILPSLARVTLGPDGVEVEFVELPG